MREEVLRTRDLLSIISIIVTLIDVGLVIWELLR